jgi:DNA-binding HxlR family transcriptional regulator
MVAQATPPAPEPLASIGEQLSQEELRSSVRVLIILSLGVNRRMSFGALLQLSHCAKGSLSYHLKQLESAGLLRVSTVFTLGGPRVVAEITEKGRVRYGGLIDELQRLPVGHETSEPVPS